MKAEDVREGLAVRRLSDGWVGRVCRLPDDGLDLFAVSLPGAGIVPLKSSSFEPVHPHEVEGCETTRRLLASPPIGPLIGSVKSAAAMAEGDYVGAVKAIVASLSEGELQSLRDPALWEPQKSIVADCSTLGGLSVVVRHDCETCSDTGTVLGHDSIDVYPALCPDCRGERVPDPHWTLTHGITHEAKKEWTAVHFDGRRADTTFQFTTELSIAWVPIINPKPGPDDPKRMLVNRTLAYQNKRVGEKVEQRSLGNLDGEHCHEMAAHRVLAALNAGTTKP